MRTFSDIVYEFKATEKPDRTAENLAILAGTGLAGGIIGGKVLAKKIPEVIQAAKEYRAGPVRDKLRQWADALEKWRDEAISDRRVLKTSLEALAKKDTQHASYAHEVSPGVYELPGGERRKATAEEFASKHKEYSALEDAIKRNSKDYDAAGDRVGANQSMANLLRYIGGPPVDDVIIAGKYASAPRRSGYSIPEVERVQQSNPKAVVKYDPKFSREQQKKYKTSDAYSGNPYVVPSVITGTGLGLGTGATAVVVKDKIKEKDNKKLSDLIASITFGDSRPRVGDKIVDITYDPRSGRAHARQIRVTPEARDQINASIEHSGKVRGATVAGLGGVLGGIAGYGLPSIFHGNPKLAVKIAGGVLGAGAAGTLGYYKGRDVGEHNRAHDILNAISRDAAIHEALKKSKVAVPRDVYLKEIREESKQIARSLQEG
jgi:hypothetical protein